MRWSKLHHVQHTSASQLRERIKAEYSMKQSPYKLPDEAAHSSLPPAPPSFHPCLKTSPQRAANPSTLKKRKRRKNVERGGGGGAGWKWRTVRQVFVISSSLGKELQRSNTEPWQVKLSQLLQDRAQISLNIVRFKWDKLQNTKPFLFVHTLVFILPVQHVLFNATFVIFKMHILCKNLKNCIYWMQWWRSKISIPTNVVAESIKSKAVNVCDKNEALKDEKKVSRVLACFSVIPGVSWLSFDTVRTS